MVYKPGGVGSLGLHFCPTRLALESVGLAVFGPQNERRVRVKKTVVGYEFRQKLAIRLVIV